MSRNHYWPDLRTLIQSYVKTCDTCQRIKWPHHMANGQLQSLEPPKALWTDISLDMITDLPPSQSSADSPQGTQYDTILTVVDRFTKMSHFIPTRKNSTAEEFSHLFIQEIVKHHSIPSSIVSDRGSIFTSKFWTTLTKSLGIKTRLSTAYHPQTDSQTERHNHTIEQYLRAMVNFQQDDWTDWLPMGEYCYNNSKNSSTSVTPFFAYTG